MDKITADWSEVEGRRPKAEGSSVEGTAHRVSYQFLNQLSAGGTTQKTAKNDLRATPAEVSLPCRGTSKVFPLDFFSF